jgi:hypothetical protein
VIGLYLNPPQHAALFCVDEKSAIQALDRKDPVLPLSPGRAKRHGFEYFRHGTRSLYATFNTKTAEVLGKTAERHTSAEFVAFLTDIVANQPRGKTDPRHRRQPLGASSSLNIPTHFDNFAQDSRRTLLPRTKGARRELDSGVASEHPRTLLQPMA